MNFGKYLISLPFLALMVATTNPASAEEVPGLDALKFMLTGDYGEGDQVGIFDVKLSGCRATHLVKAVGMQAFFTYNLNQVKWNTGQYNASEGMDVITFACDGDCTNISAEENFLFVLMMGGYSPKTLRLTVASTRDRFEAALSDFKAICPGKESKY